MLHAYAPAPGPIYLHLLPCTYSAAPALLDRHLTCSAARNPALGSNTDTSRPTTRRDSLKVGRCVAKGIRRTRGSALLRPWKCPARTRQGYPQGRMNRQHRALAGTFQEARAAMCGKPHSRLPNACPRCRQPCEARGTRPGCRHATQACCMALRPCWRSTTGQL